MIDIEAQVFDPIAQHLRSLYPGIYVTGEYVKAPSRFPHVSITESDNYTTLSRRDSTATETYAALMYEVNVYSNKASGKKAECRDIMSVIDNMLFARNFTRISMTPVPNLEDSTIYRIVARYRVETDSKTLFRL